MAVLKTRLGANSFCLTATQGTNAHEISSLILQILDEAKSEGEFNWELVANVGETFIPSNSTTYERVITLRSMTLFGVYKFMHLCVQLHSIEVLSGPDENLANAYSIGFNRPIHSSGTGTWKIIGYVRNIIQIPYGDRFDFIIFAHDQWLAFTLSPYSKQNQIYSSSYSFNNELRWSRITVQGIVGVFELFETVDSKVSALINTGLGVSSDGYTSNSNGSAVDSFLPNSGTSVVPNAQHESSDAVFSQAYHHIGRYWSNDKVSMIELTTTKSREPTRQIKDNIKIGSVHGLKVLASAAGHKDLGVATMKCDPILKCLDINGAYTPHLVCISVCDMQHREYQSVENFGYDQGIRRNYDSSNSAVLALPK